MGCLPSLLHLRYAALWCAPWCGVLRQVSWRHRGQDRKRVCSAFRIKATNAFMCLLAYHILLRKRRKRLGVRKRALLMENYLKEWLMGIQTWLYLQNVRLINRHFILENMERCHSKYYDLTPVAETEVTDAFCYRERRWRTHEWKGRGATQQTAWCEKLNQSHYVPTDIESYVLCSEISLTQCFNIKSSNQCALRQLSKLNRILKPLPPWLSSTKNDALWWQQDYWCLS